MLERSKLPRGFQIEGERGIPFTLGEGAACPYLKAGSTSGYPGLFSVASFLTLPPEDKAQARVVAVVVMAQNGAGQGFNKQRGTTHVSFVCQKCYQPLRLDQSFTSLDKETVKELTGMVLPCCCLVNWYSSYSVWSKGLKVWRAILLKIYLHVL